MVIILSSLYTLRVLQEHGTQRSASHVITPATTLACLLYESLAWWELMSVEEVDGVKGILRRVKSGSFLSPEAPNAIHMAGVADAALFAVVSRDRDHVPRKLFMEQ